MGNQLSKRKQIENDLLNIIRTRNPQTTDQLIEIAQQEIGLPEREATAIISRLENEGKLQFTGREANKNVDSEFVVFSKNTVWFWATLTIAVVATASVFVVPADLYPVGYVRQVLGLVFVLFLPGHAFVRLVFLDRVPFETGSESFDNIERLVLSVGLSLALNPIIGLVLYYTPLGLGLATTTLSIMALTLIFGLAAMAREYQTSVRSPPLPPPPPPDIVFP